jgi:hypothetical protein
MAENEAKLQQDTGQRRSPSYPVLTIDDAIVRARKVYEADRRAFATFENVATNMGYGATKKGGRTGRAVAALKQYGLLDERGGQYRISDSAFRILELPDDTPERARLVGEAALRPPVIRKILRHYEGQLPSDATLRSHLVINEGFNPDSARDFIRVVRRTVELVNPSKADYNAGEESDEVAQTNAGGAPLMPPTTTQPGTPQTGLRAATKEEFNRAFASSTASQLHALGIPVPGQGKELRFNISRDSEAQVIFYGPVTQEAIDKLAKLLELQKDTFPTRDELERPRAAIWRNKDHDQPVTITGELGEKDGKRFYAAKETGTGIPEDELEFEDAKAKGAA